MKITDFKINEFFYGAAGFKWLCTDIGTRTITAIMVTDARNSDWIKGPPYALEEKVFDEHAMKICAKSDLEMLQERMEFSYHPNFHGDDVFKMMKDNGDYKYPRKHILRIDRVSPEGYILHPYSANKENDQWFIKTLELFSRQFSQIHEDEFVKLPLSSQEAMKKRGESIGHQWHSFKD